MYARDCTHFEIGANFWMKKLGMLRHEHRVFDRRPASPDGRMCFTIRIRWVACHFTTIHLRESITTVMGKTSARN